MAILRQRADGVRIWWLDALDRHYHRENGPAVELPNGTKGWYHHGLRHREGGPAIDRGDGTRSWWLHGELHREGGPAIERANGKRQWWIHGKRSWGAKKDKA